MVSTFSRAKELFKLTLSYYTNHAFVKPSSVTICLTARCNLQCIMCDIWKFPSKPKVELSTKKIKNIINQMDNWEIKNLSLDGGEPFLRKDIFDLIEYAKSKCIITNVITNATLINKNIAKRIISSGLDHITFSLDGATARTHDLIRGRKGSFKRLIQAAGYLKDAMRIGANTVVVEENFDELLDIVLLSRKIGIKENTFQARLASNADPKKTGKLLPKKKIVILKNGIGRINRARRSIGGIITSESDLNDMIAYFKNRYLLEPRHCLIGYKDMHINVNGDVIFCGGLDSGGNIKERTLREIWNSNESYILRKKYRGCKTPCLTTCSPSLEQYYKFIIS